MPIVVWTKFSKEIQKLALGTGANIVITKYVQDLRDAVMRATGVWV